MENKGFIKLFRSLLDWEWYDDINVKLLFIHLLLKANYTDKQWRGVDIKKGSYVTSYGNLSSETGISVMQVRTCLKKLKVTGEITIKTTNSFTLVTLNNYDKYNGDNTVDNKQVTNKQQTDNKRITTTKEGKKEKKVRKETTKSIRSIFFNNILTSGNIYKDKSGSNILDDKNFIETYHDFIDMRKHIKSPLTQRAMELNLLKASKYEIDVFIKMINRSIENSWKGIFDLDNNSNNKNNFEESDNAFANGAY